MGRTGHPQNAKALRSTPLIFLRAAIPPRFGGAGGAGGQKNQRISKTLSNPLPFCPRHPSNSLPAGVPAAGRPRWGEPAHPQNAKAGGKYLNLLTSFGYAQDNTFDFFAGSHPPPFWGGQGGRAAKKIKGFQSLIPHPTPRNKSHRCSKTIIFIPLTP